MENNRCTDVDKSYYKKFFDEIEDCLIVVNEATQILDANEAATKLLGYSLEQLCCLNIFDIHPPEMKQDVMLIIQDLLQDKTDRSKVPLYTNNGEYVPVETRLIKGILNGQRVAFGISRDTTKELKNAEFQLEIENQKRLLKTLIDAIPDLIFYKNKKSVYLGCNKAFSEGFIGMDEDKIIGKSDYDILGSKEEADFFRQKDKAVLQSMTSITNEETVILSNGKQVELETVKTPFFNEDGKAMGLIGISRDITVRHEFEKQLSHQKEYAEMLLKTVPSAVFTVDNNQSITSWNRMAEKITGYTAGEAIGKRCELFSKDKINIEGLYSDGIAKPMIGKECRIRDKQGNIHFVSKNTDVLTDEKGNIIGRIECFDDITERVAMEKQLMQAKAAAEVANKLKSQFLANMSHEIRTPISGIVGFLDLLHKTNLTSEQIEYILEAKAASEAMLYLINDILDFSKIEAGKMEIENINFEIRSIVEASISVLKAKANEKGLQMQYIIDERLPRVVSGDPLRLKQILNNLISNAIKFTEKGEIKIEVLQLDTKDENAIIKFSVADSGIGISEKDIEKLFEPFMQADASTTRKYGGSGLGLAISRELVKKIGGEIKIESELGVGSTFSFILEYKIMDKDAIIDYQEITNNTKEVNKDFKANLSLKLLLVEDNEINRKIIKKMLGKYNMECDTAIDGAEAIAILKKQDYDIVFMDCQMPVMDGYVTTKEIRESEGKEKHTIIIALTANAMEEDRTKCIKAGMDDYISKPIDFNVLLGLIEKYSKKNEEKMEHSDVLADYLEVFIYETGLDREDAEEIFEDFKNYLPDIISKMDNALENEELETLANLAHQLKGSSGNLRIKEIFRLTNLLKEHATAERIKDCKEVLLELKNMLRAYLF